MKSYHPEFEVTDYRSPCETLLVITSSIFGAFLANPRMPTTVNHKLLASIRRRKRNPSTLFFHHVLIMVIRHIVCEKAT